MLMKEISSSFCNTNSQYQQFRNSGRYRDLWHLHIPKLPKTTQHLFLKRLPKFYMFQTIQTTMRRHHRMKQTRRWQKNRRRPQRNLIAKPTPQKEQIKTLQNVSKDRRTGDEKKRRSTTIYYQPKPPPKSEPTSSDPRTPPVQQTMTLKEYFCVKPKIFPSRV
jgi:hypothetical protein